MMMLINYDDWKLETPPTFEEDKKLCIFCEEEEAVTADSYGHRCCERCKKEVEEEEQLLFITI